MTATADAATSDAQPSAAFTPGPWSLCHDGRCTCGFVFDDYAGAHIATVHSSRDLGSDHYAADIAALPARAAANARLIAAAPDLYEALAMVVAALDASRDGGAYPDFEVWEASARAALAKAAPAPQSGVTATGREADPGSTQ